MKRYIQKLEFYITNVCNLVCPDCNRFNNHSFKGHQIWHDYELDYEQWARKLEVSGLVILGGEPLLNPSICDWIRGLNRCFGQHVEVLTNGTRLNHTMGLYEALAEHNSSRNGPNWIGISVHNSDDLDRYIHEAQCFLQGQVVTYHGRDCKDHTGDLISYGADYTLVDENEIAVRLWIQDKFSSAAIHRSPPVQVDGEWRPGELTVYDNDPVLAHEACAFAHWKNYHMIRGHFYKCGPCVLMADFDEQNPLAISDQDRSVMRSYQGLSPWADEKTTHRFFKYLDDVIPQCKFCPTQEQMQQKQIRAVLKKKGSTGTFG